MKRKIIKSFTRIKGDTLIKQFNKTPRVLFWHGVDTIVNQEVETEIFDVNLFKQQIEYLNRNFEIISIEEFEQRFLSNKFTNREIVLTFDDGYANNLYIVEPILQKYNLPFTVFISTEHITTGKLFSTSVNRIILKGSGLKKIDIPSQELEFVLGNKKSIDNATKFVSNLLKTLPINEVLRITQDLINNVSKERWEELKEKYKSVRPMNWDEVIELSSRDYVTIGSHCKEHICCHSNHSEMLLERQIGDSRKIIEDRILKKTNYFAYPNGDYTDFSKKVVSENYSMGFSTNANRVRPNSESAIMPRVGVPRDFDKFKILINLLPRK